LKGNKRFDGLAAHGLRTSVFPLEDWLLILFFTFGEVSVDFNILDFLIVFGLTSLFCVCLFPFLINVRTRHKIYTHFRANLVRFATYVVVL